MTTDVRPAVVCCALTVTLTLMLAGCDQGRTSQRSTGASPTAATGTSDASSDPGSAPSRTPRPTPPTGRGTPTSQPPGEATAQTKAQRVLRQLSLEEQVGQLLVAGVPGTGASADVLRELRIRHVGSIMLTGRSERGVRATEATVHEAQKELTGQLRPTVPLLVATDQEGGAVQVLRGPGFDDIPSARHQGRWGVGRLRSQARRWGGQLRAAGVNLDLAPVADIVPRSPDPSTNGPIGHFDRQFGPDAGSVRSHATAFACGMAAAGVATAVKHFPGLGYVRGNTDTSTRVVDHTIGSEHPGLKVFTGVADACGSVVMTSTAVYDRLDPDHPASFSGAVITSLLRRRLGFDGVVVSDDLGSARQVRAWRPGERARMFVSAGGDLVLTVEPSDVPRMSAALTAAARHGHRFRVRVRESALRVLTLKARLGLLEG
jgi:beta-N-acetylhexosaminidase